jgi:DNA-binding MarR family transcriptional regulator
MARQQGGLLPPTAWWGWAAVLICVRGRTSKERSVTVEFGNRETDEQLAFWYMLRRTYLAVLKARQRELDRYGISAEAAGVLHAVVRLDKGATPTSIAAQLSLERNSVSEHLKRMENEGLVEKVRDLDRKNRVRVKLTKKGRDVYSKSSRNRSTLRIMAVLTPEERRQVWLLLARIQTRALKQRGVKRPMPYPSSSPDNGD